jgi:hypothetical protein
MTETEAETVCAGRWETVEGCVRNLANDPDATEFEKSMTEFRLMVRASDGRRYGCRTLVDTARFERAAFDLYDYMLDALVHDVETALARHGVTAR